MKPILIVEDRAQEAKHSQRGPTTAHPESSQQWTGCMGGLTVTPGRTLLPCRPSAVRWPRGAWPEHQSGNAGPAPGWQPSCAHLPSPLLEQGPARNGFEQELGWPRITHCCTQAWLPVLQPGSPRGKAQASGHSCTKVQHKPLWCHLTYLRRRGNQSSVRPW